MKEYLRPQSGYPAVRRMAVQPALRIPPFIPPAEFGPSQPGAYGTDRTAIALPGANYPPAGATPVDILGSAAIAPGANGVLLTFQVPDTQRFRLAGIGFGAPDETATGFLSWTITAPDPQGGYIAKSAVIGSIGFLADVFYVWGSSVLVSVVGTAATDAVVSYNYECRIRGWTWIEGGA